MPPFTQLILFVVAIIALAGFSGLLSKQLDLPSGTFQLLAGILLGPSVFNLLEKPVILGTWGSISPSPLHDALKILAEIGLIQVMFFAGMKTDWGELRRHIDGISKVGIWGFALSAAATAVVARLFSESWVMALAVAAILSASSFGISIYSLNEMKLLGSKAVTISTGASLLSASLALLLMVASLTTNYAMLFGGIRTLVAVSWFMGKLIMFLAIAYFLASRFLKLAGKTGLQKRPWQMILGYLLLVAAIYAWAALHFGSFAAIGVASLGGALLSLSSFETKEKLGKGLGTGPASLLVGVFFIALGMEANLAAAWEQPLLLFVLLATVVTPKLLSLWIAERKTFQSFPEKVFVMLWTTPQGEAGMVIAAYLFSRGLMNPVLFNQTITVVVILTTISPVLVKIGEKLFLRDSLPVTLSPLSPGGIRKG